MYGFLFSLNLSLLSHQIIRNDQLKKQKSTLQHDSESNASDDQKVFRGRLLEMFKHSPMPDEELVASLGMYMRSSVLVKILVLEDLYRRVLNVPGSILEFGCRWGHNLVLFENLRAILEPFNKTRKVIGFDTFQGYHGQSPKDKLDSDIFREDTYQTTHNYRSYLQELLEVHEGNSVLGHQRGQHELIEGNIEETAQKYFIEHPGATVALAYFDVGLYGPTKSGLEAIRPHLVPGSVILWGEFTWSEAPGEAIAFKEFFKKGEYKIEKSIYTPMRAIVTVT